MNVIERYIKIQESNNDLECSKELTKIGYGTEEQLWMRLSGEIDKEKLVNNIKPTWTLYKHLFRLWNIEWKPKNIKLKKKFIEWATEEFIFKNTIIRISENCGN